MFDYRDSFRKWLGEGARLKHEIASDERLVTIVNDVASTVATALRGGNRVIFAGNGGSAADSQHLAAEFVSRFEFDRPGLPALSLSTDTSMLTAIGNDYGYENLFARQIQAQATSGDVFFGITTSGKSANVLRAFESCRDKQVTTVALCGLGGELESTVDFAIRVPSTHTARIQECHIAIGHAICGAVELDIFGSHVE